LAYNSDNQTKKNYSTKLRPSQKVLIKRKKENKHIKNLSSLEDPSLEMKLRYEMMLLILDLLFITFRK